MSAYETSRVARMRYFQICGLVLVCALPFSGLSMAQTSVPETADLRPAAPLINPTISSRDLAYRLVPLTKDELEPLAKAWLEIVRTKTEEIAERQVELLHDPSLATDDAYQSIAKMVEARARLFERFSMVVNALEGKGGDEALVKELRAYRESVLCLARLNSQVRKPSPRLSSRG